MMYPLSHISKVGVQTPTAVVRSGYLSEKFVESIKDDSFTLLGMKAQTHGTGSRDTIIYPIEHLPENEFIYKKISEIVEEINETDFDFDVEGIPSPLQLLVYKNGGHYDWHVDIGPGDASRRKLSVIIQLSSPDEYEGGDVILHAGEERVLSKEKGTIAVFPSYVLHKVNPVTKGTRQALVCWVLGQRKFK